MHKIRKYQYGSTGLFQQSSNIDDNLGSQTIDNTTAWFTKLLSSKNNNPLNLGLSQKKFQNSLNLAQLTNPLSVKATKFDPTKITTSALNNQISKSSITSSLPSKLNSSLSSSTQDIIGTVGNSIEPIAQIAGAKQADNISAGEQAFSQGTSLAFNTALKTGNPIAIGITGGLKALDLTNRYFGSTAKQQGTLGLDTGGYSFNLNPEAGDKQTLLGTIFGQTKKINHLTQISDRSNLKAGQSTYQNKRKLIGAQNTVSTISQKNQQQLFGGVNTNILAARQGIKISPIKLRQIKQKVKYPIKEKKPEVITKKDEEPISTPDPLTKSEQKAQWKASYPHQGFSILQTGDKIVPQFGEGGQLNVIPDGALHARKNNYEGELGDAVTNKGIPVITYNENGEITQHAEIEKNEIIFTKSTTDKLENFFKEYNDATSIKDKDLIAIECGKFLALEILESTDDKTGLIKTIE